MSFAETLSQWRESASSIELDQIDWEEPGSWPGLVKAFMLLLAFVVVLGLGYQFLAKAQIQKLETVEREEVTLREDFTAKAFEAANLDALREQMQEMQLVFNALVNQLPSDTQVPGLLEDISAIGVSNGLEFNSVELQAEVAQEFYVELPIDILVSGTYHDLGAFVSGIAGLPRIVTLHDFEINPIDDRPGLMEMRILAKTYRYKDEEA